MSGRLRSAMLALAIAQTSLGAIAAQESAAAPAAPAAPSGGMALYLKLCSQCHGDQGDGKGIAADRLVPRPRDFTAGKFKIRHTPSGALPTDDDLRHIIRFGMPATSMPAWPQLSDAQIEELVTAVKSFSPDFANPEKQPAAVAIPKAPEWSAESAEKGKEVYAQIGCGACHGELGRGDGTSAATLTDDWGNPIRAADLTMRWTYRGGPTREDIYRTFTTGVNGTPMPSFAESLSDEQRWQLVDYIASLDSREEPGYSNLMQVQWSADELDLSRGQELFATAPAALFPIVGQVTEPGRAFHPSAQAVTVRAVYNAKEIAFLVTWHDMRADTKGRNAPDLPVPEEDSAAAPSAGPGAAAEDFWGEEAAAPEAAAAEPPAGDDFWGEEAAPAPATGDAAAGDDFWGEGEGDAAAAPITAATEFSDAMAIQLPVQLPSGIRKPYFLFGDSQNPVDLWFVDLANPTARRYLGAGSKSLTPVEGEDVTAAASYDRGEWSVIMKRSLRARGGVTFAEGQYVPVAFTVWDGHQRERGNRRGLTQWMYLYTMPKVTPSPIWPMLRSALAVLALELALVWWVRRRQRTAQPGSQSERQSEQSGRQPEAAR